MSDDFLNCDLLRFGVTMQDDVPHHNSYDEAIGEEVEKNINDPIMKEKNNIEEVEEVE